MKFFALLTLALVSGCGLRLGLPMPVPSSGSQNGNLPTGSTLVAQAPLVQAAGSGAMVSGTAAIYNEGNGSYVIQLQNLNASFPTTPETVYAVINGLQVSGGTLVSATGTSNYNFTTTAGANISAVYIQCASCVLGSGPYATAIF